VVVRDPDTAASRAPLAGLTIIEMATFVAGPSAGMTLAQLGADVVRIDPIGGAVDVTRWPLAANGRSLYWSALNRGKRSVTIDVRNEPGRELVRRLISAPGPDAGIFIDNASAQDWLSWAELSRVRADLIHVHIEGHRDGRPAVDYTVNAEVGVPLITGPKDYSPPVNHVLPAWDLLCGMSAVAALLAALRRRDRTGEGSRIDIALADVALAGVANLGWLSEAAQSDVDRVRQGNNLYGSYGNSFVTGDGRHVMVVALTPNQWKSLVTVTGADAAIDAVATSHGVDFVRDESARYSFRDEIATAFAPWFAGRDYPAVAAALTDARVLWAPYRTLREAAGAMEGPLQRIDQAGIGKVISAESPMRWQDIPPINAPAPALGADTVTTLKALAGIDDDELSRLVATGVVAGATSD
jgi:2-methylfumaryl-CoA isomerase